VIISNKKHLLIVMFGLVAMRFIVVPLLSWQDDLVADLETKQSRLTKGRNLVERKEQIDSGIEKLEQHKKALINNYFLSDRGMDELKLRSQQRIESLLSEHSLQVRSFNWVSDIPGAIQETRAQVSFSGKTKDVAQFQLALAQAPQLINLVELSLRLNGLVGNTLGQADGTAVLALYNIPSASPLSAELNQSLKAGGKK
jgi:Tfp pilus assembly protein PilO